MPLVLRVVKGRAETEEEPRRWRLGCGSGVRAAAAANFGADADDTAFAECALEDAAACEEALIAGTRALSFKGVSLSLSLSLSVKGPKKDEKAEREENLKENG